jgi:transaldolase
MEFFLDTANVSQIKEINSWGILAGVTTNPSLVASEGRDFKETVLEICGIVDGPISAEAVSTDAEGMMREARELSAWHRNIVVKIPMTAEGLKAVKMCSQEGIRTNVTLIFSLSQAILAAVAGATYVSPFVGRLDDTSWDGFELIRDMVPIFDYYDFETRIIAASIRHPMHVIEAARAGAHIATIPYKVAHMLLKHPLTDAGIKKFLEDWEKVPKGAK